MFISALLFEKISWNFFVVIWVISSGFFIISFGLFGFNSLSSMIGHYSFSYSFYSSNGSSLF